MKERLIAFTRNRINLIKEEHIMSKYEKKRIVKALAGGAVCMAARVKSQKLIEEKVTKRPHSDIAVKLSDAFWSICYTLYAYYIVGEKES